MLTNFYYYEINANDDDETIPIYSYCSSSHGDNNSHGLIQTDSELKDMMTYMLNINRKRLENK
jgi:hypothetical protein